MASNWQLDCLFNRISALSAEIARVRDKEHPYVEPRVVYTALLSVLSRHRNALISAKEDYPDPSDAALLHAAYVTIAIGSNEVAEAFKFVDRVDTSRIPFDILPALSWATDNIMDFESRIIVRVDPDINYSIVSLKQYFSSHDWEDDWTEAARDTDTPDAEVLSLGIPSAYAGSVLVNALAAHEIGHLLYAKRKEAIETLVDATFKRSIEQHSSRIQHHLMDQILPGSTGRQAVDPDSYNARAEAFSRDARDTADCWSREIYADLVGAHLLGPAFIAALDRILVGDSESSDTHPSDSFRRHVLMTFVTRALPNIDLQAHWSALSVSGSQPVATDEIERFAESVCTSLVDAFADNLKDVTSPLRADPEEFEAVLAAMRSHIEHLSPPSVAIRGDEKWMSELGFWAMIYAAWQFRLDADAFSTFAQLSDAEDALGNVLLQGLKSLELSVRLRNHQTDNGRETVLL